MKRFISVITSIFLAISLLLPAAGGITAFAEESSLALGNVISLTPSAEGQITFNYFSFTPESTGAYKCRVFDSSQCNTGYINVYNQNELVSSELLSTRYDDKTAFTAFYLEAGVNYRISIQFSKNCSLIFLKCDLATDFEVRMNGSSTGEEYTSYTGLSAYLYTPRNSTAYIGDLTYSFSDPAVASVKDGAQNDIVFLKAGETDMTVSTVFGLKKTVHITVNDPIELEYNNSKPIDLRSYVFSFIAPENGLFGILTDSPYGSMQIYHNYESVAYWKRTVNGVMCQYEMKAGEKYIISGQNNGNSLGNIVVIKPTKAESLSLITSDGKTLTDFSCNTCSTGNRIIAYTSFGPENAAFENVELYNNSNTDVVRAENSWSNEINITPLNTGVAVLTYRSESGLETSVTVTVEEPGRLTENQPLTVTYNAAYLGERAFLFTPSEDGNYVLKIDNCKGFENGSANIRMADGTTTISSAYSYQNRSVKLSAENLIKGHTYTVFCNMSGYTNSNGLSDSASLDMTVSKGVAVESLELLTPPDIRYVYQGEQPNDFNGLSILVKYTDGTSSIWKYKLGDYEIDGYKIELRYSSPYDEKPYVTVVCSGKEATYYYELRQCDIVAFEHIPYEDLIYDASYIPSAYSYRQDLEGECFKVTYKNGNIEYKYLKEMNSNGYYGLFIRDVATGLYESVQISSSQTYSEDAKSMIWDVKKKNYISITYHGAECRIPVSTVNAESLGITEIKPASGAALRFTENSGSGYGGPNGYIYVVDSYELSEITVDIIYNNGERIDRNIPIGSKYNGIVFNYFDSEDQQTNTPWVIGKNNALKVNYGGIEFEIPVIITKESSDIKSAEIISQPTYYYGDPNTGGVSEEGYYFSPEMREGFIIRLPYTDDNNNPVILDSSMLDSNGKINGKSVWLSLPNGPIPEYKETVDMLLVYGGERYSVTIRLEKPLISGLKLIKEPTIPKYGFMSPDFIGTEIEISYADNNKKTVKFTKENTYFDSERRNIAVNTKDGIIEVYYNSYNNSYRFNLTNSAFIIKATETPKYDESSISNITLVREATGILGSVIKISFTDDSEIEVTLNDISGLFNTQNWGMASSEFGLMEFYCHINDNYYQLGFIHNYFTIKTSIRVLAGDMNGDGSLDIRDMVRLKKHLAGKAEICRKNADITIDSSVSADDMAELKKSLLGKTRLTLANGDINCDGSFSEADIKLLNAYLAGNKDILLPKIADFDGNGIIDKNDLAALKQKFKNDFLF